MADRIEADIERIEDLEANMVSRVWIPKQSAYSSDTRRHKHKFADGTIRGYSADEEDAIIYGRREFRKTTSQVRIAYSDSVYVDLTCDSASVLAIGDAVKINEHGMHIGAVAADATTKVVVDGEILSTANTVKAAGATVSVLSYSDGSTASPNIDLYKSDSATVGVAETTGDGDVLGEVKALGVDDSPTPGFRAAAIIKIVQHGAVTAGGTKVPGRLETWVGTDSASPTKQDSVSVAGGHHLARSLVVGNLADDPGDNNLLVDGNVEYLGMEISPMVQIPAGSPVTTDSYALDLTGQRCVALNVSGGSTAPTDHSWGVKGGVGGQLVEIQTSYQSELINGIATTDTVVFPGGYTKLTLSSGYCTVVLRCTSAGYWRIVSHVGGTFS